MMEVLQIPSELDQMRALFIERAPERIIEIGCWDGGTLREWLTHGSPTAMIVAVDLEHRNRDAYEEWLQPDQDLRLYTGNSMEQPAKDFVASHAPYDWAFIDGDHSGDGVRSDWATIRPHMAPRGLVLIHDIMPPMHLSHFPPGVFFDELAETYESWSYKDPEFCRDSRGIGVIQL